jgi:FecR protein
MNDRRRLFLIALLALTLGVFPLAAAAQNTGDTGSHVRIVRISYLQGTVQYNDVPAIMNSPVTEGSRLVTGADGVAEVEFEDQSAIRLASETEISFAQLARLSTGEARTRVDLEDGEAEFLIPASSAGRFAVNVRGQNILFKQPGRFRILSTDATPLEIAVWKGEAGVRDLESGHEVAVKAHETLALNPENLGQYDLQNSVLGDDLDRWSEQRDQDLRTNYVAGNTYNNTLYDQYYQTGGYGNGYVAPYPYPYDFYGYNAFGCPYGFGQPFWFGSPGYCWNSGFFFNPFFFSPPVVVVVVRPPILPRRPIPLRPPTLPPVAKGGTGHTGARPGFRNFREPGEGQRVLNDENFQRTGIKPGESTGAPAQNNTPQNSMNETVRTPSILPGQHPAGSSVPPPAHAAPPPPRPQHSSPPPARLPSHSFSGPRGPSGGSFPHASAPAAHSSGRIR